MFSNHLRRLKEGVNNVFTLTNLATWMERNIRLDGNLYTFGAKYGFQRDILNDNSRVNNTVKPAQIGMTTATMGYGLAGTATQKKFNVIYALPTAGDATKLVTTKLNPLIHGSPEVYRLLNKEVDSTELKEINGNFLFIRGTKSETAALSISADCLIVDEQDRCDPDVVKQFRSRLQASDLQIIRQFSTPTIEGVGISKEAETSRRYRHMAKCDCCGNVWLPSYHTDIAIPGYTGALEHITETTLKDIRWNEATWVCPRCGRDPKLHPDRLEWVCENPNENYEAHTHFITPVTACLVLKPSYLVRTSTEFNTRAEWNNQVLGETSENKSDQITEEDVLAATVRTDLNSSEVHVMGFDMGLLCNVAIGRISQSGDVLVVHREQVPLGIFETRRLELIREYRVVTSVHDVYPYTSEIMKICDYDTNAYGAVFDMAKSMQMYVLQEKKENVDEAKLNLRLLKINRTLLLDYTMDLFKSRKLLMADTHLDFKPHYVSMKRTQVFVGDELAWIWQKVGKAIDHQHFALGYMLLAWEMRTRQAWSNTTLELVSSFKVKAQKLLNVEATSGYVLPSRHQ